MKRDALLKIKEIYSKFFKEDLVILVGSRSTGYNNFPIIHINFKVVIFINLSI
ncbi:MAG: hypothetical protein IH845_05270 [Nanoarchaeota archaeon]|nr:hypothetical protein [Nanoarchaeota archaeon]